MNRYRIIIALIAAVLLLGLVGGASAASVTVAASNSQVKDTAQYLGDGSDDQVEIQAAINNLASSGGGDVILLDGTFTLSDSIRLGAGVNLIGQGADTTILTLVNVGGVSVSGTSNLRDFGMTGLARIGVTGSHVTLTNITIRDYTSWNPAFYVYAANEVISDITFTNCNAIDGSSYGFKNSGEGSPNSISNITYSGCSAINAGRASQASPWIVGFDLTETTTITNMLVENCRAEGSWESGFYFEDGPQKTNVILRNCISLDNGQKKTAETPFYGAGFLGGSPTMQFIDCTSQGNVIGFWLFDGATVIRGRDMGSVQAFRTSNHGAIALTDCWSDQAQQWALYGLLSHDVTATNFMVTNPEGNPYPAILTGSSTYPSYNMNIQLGTGTPPSATPIPTTASPIPTVVGDVAIPGQLLAANYEVGGEGVAYHDTTPENQGGVYRDDDVDIEYEVGGTNPVIAYTRAGEWLNYQVMVQQTGEYTIATRASNPDSNTKQILLSIDGVSTATLLIPGTSSFDRYTSVSTPVQLTAGHHQLRLTFPADRQNLEGLTFTGGVSTVQPEPTPEVTTQVTPPTTGGEPSFTAAPTSGKRSLLVSFEDTSPGSPVGWYWQITGGWASPATSTQQNPSIWLNEAKSYTVTLTVTYADGSQQTTTVENYITVTD